MSTPTLILSNDLLRGLSKVIIDEKVIVHEEKITSDDVIVGSFLTSSALMGAAYALSFPYLAIAGASVYYTGVIGSMVYKLVSNDKLIGINNIKKFIIDSARTVKNWSVLASLVVCNVAGSTLIGAGSFYTLLMVTADLPCIILLAYEGIPLKPLLFQILNTLGITLSLITAGTAIFAFSLTGELFLDEEFKMNALGLKKIITNID
jgi:hypothetical protein